MIKNIIIVFLSGILFTCFLPIKGHACTSFSIEHGGRHLVGKNHDWMVADGMIFVNKKGLEKKALHGKHVKGAPAFWVSKYGSVTFNLYGREMPTGGMNEAGLVIENMQLAASQYPTPDARPFITRTQWVQYQLDNFSTVKEVIESDAELRISKGMGPGIHYLCVDKQGNNAIIEFIDGKMVYYLNDNMPFRVLANSTYADSVAHVKSLRQAGHNFPMPIGSESLARFTRAVSMIKQYKKDQSESLLGYAFDILSNVSQGFPTKWGVVYDVLDLRIYFQTRGKPEPRYFDLQSFDFSCDSPVKTLNVHAKVNGNVIRHFKNYTFQDNYDLIKKAFQKSTVFGHLPEQVLKQIALYPENNHCKKMNETNSENKRWK